MESLKCKIQFGFDSIISLFISYGGAFVECSLEHPSEVEIVQLVFRINEVSDVHSV